MLHIRASVSGRYMNKTKPILSKATVADCQVLAEMNKRLIIDEGHSNPMNIPELKERMIKFIENEYNCYLILSEQTVVGYCLFRDDIDYIYIRQLYVKDEYRKQGYGRQCLEELKKTEWKNRKLRIEVMSHNSNGIAFWKRVGFVDYCIVMENNTLLD
jgi:ribosomal protein S18 acetylase RimI-like enzyme